MTVSSRHFLKVTAKHDNIHPCFSHWSHYFILHFLLDHNYHILLLTPNLEKLAQTVKILTVKASI